MSMRIFSAVAIACLAGCTSGDGEPLGDRIACAVDGATDFAEVCFAERWQVEDTMFLVIRHPDGGFRRFEVLSGGRGIEAADGMEDARVSLKDGFLEASIAGDRYRIPVKQGSGAAPAPAATKTEQVTQIGEGAKIACAVDGNREYRAECVMEPVEIEGERSVLVRHPDGGFRRFVATQDGAGLTPADGVDFAVAASSNGVTEIEVNGDAYRIPDGAVNDGSR